MRANVNPVLAILWRFSGTPRAAAIAVRGSASCGIHAHTGLPRRRVIMPVALNACTHEPTIMIGEKAAAMIGDEA
jgi:hypothetical protein